MRTGQPHATPDEGEKRVRQPVEPAQASFRGGILQVQIRPLVQKSIRADSGNEVGPEAVRAQVASAHVVVALKRDYSPAERPFRQQRSSRLVDDTDMLSYRWSFSVTKMLGWGAGNSIFD